jgi:hypothetical protein
MILEGALTESGAARLVEAVNKRYCRKGLLRAEVGKRLISKGGLDPALAVALTALAIKIAEFVIKLWELRSQRPRAEKKGLARPSSTEMEPALQVFAVDRGNAFKLVRHEKIESLSGAGDGHCTLVFSVAGEGGESSVVAQIQGNVDGCIVFLQSERL